MSITGHDVVRFLELVAARIKEQRAYLTELDSPIGDADHGINLDRGFSAVLAKLPGVAEKDIGTILKTTALTLISTVGGASGPLYGTAFLRASTVLSDYGELDGPELVTAFEQAIQGIRDRGKAHQGEKTMLDTLVPALDALRAALDSGAALPQALRAAADAAEQGMRSTIPMLATKGRASYLGERSIGHQDPGATSSHLMIAAMAELAGA